MVWLLAAAALGLFANFGVRWLSRPIVYRRRADAMSDMVEMPRMSGAGSVLRVEHEGSGRFIQFVQRSDTLGIDDILFGFPDAPWSRPFFDDMRRRLGANGIEFVIRETGRADTRRFLEVPISGNDESVTLAATDLIGIAMDALDLPEGAVFEVHVDGAPDHAKWAWRTRDHLESLKAQGGLRGRAASWSLSQLKGRKVDRRRERGGRHPDSTA